MGWNTWILPLPALPPGLVVKWVPDIRFCRCLMVNIPRTRWARRRMQTRVTPSLLFRASTPSPFHGLLVASKLTVRGRLERRWIGTGNRPLQWRGSSFDSKVPLLLMLHQVPHLL